MSQSALLMLGLPREFGVTLLVLTLALTLLPYLAGHDFGIVRLPGLEARQQSKLRTIGPIALAAAVALHLPVLPAQHIEANSLALIPLAPASTEAADISIASSVNSNVMAILAADSGLRIASSRSAKTIGDKEKTELLAAQLRVAYVFEGSVVRNEHGEVRLWVHMVSGKDGSTSLVKEFCAKDSSQRSLVTLSQSVANAIRSYVVEPEALSLARSIQAGHSQADCESAPRSRASVLVTFDPDSSRVTASAREALAVLASAMSSEKLRDQAFLVEAHATTRPDEAANIRLSEARALSVKATLVEMGLDPTRIATNGKGSADLMNPEDRNAPENSRVTIVALPR